MPTPPKKKPVDPNQQPPVEDDEGGDGEQPMTRDDITRLVNGAISSQLARKLPKAIEEGLTPALAPLMKRLESFAPASGGGDEGEGEEGAGGDQGDGGVPKQKGAPKDPATAALTRKLNTMERELKEERDLRTKEAEARKSAKIDSELTSALTEIGVDKHRLRGALAVHRASAIVDDGGAVLVRVKRDGYDEDLEPGQHLKDWAATDEGKSYIAATGAQGGAGARPPRQQGPARKPAANSPEAKQESVREAKQTLLSAVGELTAGGSVSIE